MTQIHHLLELFKHKTPWGDEHALAEVRWFREVGMDRSINFPIVALPPHGTVFRQSGELCLVASLVPTYLILVPSSDNGHIMPPGENLALLLHQSSDFLTHIF